MQSPQQYLTGLVKEMKAHWPENRTIQIVCHGHSVPAGYFATPLVDTFNAYPHLLHVALKTLYPYSVVNVTVTAIGGEDSQSGAGRIQDVLAMRPDVLTIDYALNDRRLGLEVAGKAWRAMIEAALAKETKVLLLTPTLDITSATDDSELAGHADQIRSFAEEYNVGLVDSFAAMKEILRQGTDIRELLSWPNHPNRAGHDIVARELLRWFPVA